MQVEFKFEPGQTVKTRLGEEGFVDSCSVNRNGKSYYVELPGGKGRWYQEEDIEAV